jgi:hypothetical protein
MVSHHPDTSGERMTDIISRSESIAVFYILCIAIALVAVVAVWVWVKFIK